MNSTSSTMDPSVSLIKNYFQFSEREDIHIATLIFKKVCNEFLGKCWNFDFMGNAADLDCFSVCLWSATRRSGLMEDIFLEQVGMEAQNDLQVAKQKMCAEFEKEFERYSIRSTIAQYYLGLTYAEKFFKSLNEINNEVLVFFQKALCFLNLASASGHRDGTYQLGRVYEIACELNRHFKKEIIANPIEKAKECYRKAEEKGHLLARAKMLSFSLGGSQIPY